MMDEQEENKQLDEFMIGFMAWYRRNGEPTPKEVPEKSKRKFRVLEGGKK